MGPKNPPPSRSEDLFRSRLENMISQRHPLVRLAESIDWSVFEERWGALFESGLGRPAIPTRLIAGLHYLKHTYNLSDEAVVRRWVENPYWQYFSGMKWFEHKVPIHPSSMTRWTVAW